MDRPCAGRNVVQIARNDPNYHKGLTARVAPARALVAQLARRLGRDFDLINIEEARHSANARESALKNSQNRSVAASTRCPR